jgi:hypothetical protein
LQANPNSPDLLQLHWGFCPSSLPLDSQRVQERCARSAGINSQRQSDGQPRDAM